METETIELSDAPETLAKIMLSIYATNYHDEHSDLTILANMLTNDKMSVVSTYTKNLSRRRFANSTLHPAVVSFINRYQIVCSRSQINFFVGGELKCIPKRDLSNILKMLKTSSQLSHLLRYMRLIDLSHDEIGCLATMFITNNSDHLMLGYLLCIPKEDKFILCGSAEEKFFVKYGVQKHNFDIVCGSNIVRTDKNLLQLLMEVQALSPEIHDLIVNIVMESLKL